MASDRVSCISKVADQRALLTGAGMREACAALLALWGGRSGRAASPRRSCPQPWAGKQGSPRAGQTEEEEQPHGTE